MVTRTQPVAREEVFKIAVLAQEGWRPADADGGGWVRRSDVHRRIRTPEEAYQEALLYPPAKGY